MDYLSPIPFHMASFVWCTLEWFCLDLCVCVCACVHIYVHLKKKQYVMCRFSLTFSCSFVSCVSVCAQSLSHVQLFVTPWTVASRLLCPWNFPNRNTGVGFAISSSRGSSQPKDWTWVSCIGRRILHYWTSWEAPDVRIEICIICCGNNDKTGSPFSWGDLAKVWGESWHFHWVWKDKY